jgi:hypothetical protein
LDFRRETAILRLLWKYALLKSLHYGLKYFFFPTPHCCEQLLLNTTTFPVTLLRRREEKVLKSRKSDFHFSTDSNARGLAEPGNASDWPLNVSGTLLPGALRRTLVSERSRQITNFEKLQVFALAQNVTRGAGMIAHGVRSSLNFLVWDPLSWFNGQKLENHKLTK